MGERASGRVRAVDLLRGLVMVVMALDHTRDYVHAAAMSGPPEDLARTTPAIFLTRWITHFCAPAFMFCAGLGAWFRLESGARLAALSRFLWTRGLWLIVLELSVVRFGFFFGLADGAWFLLVFWALGAGMIALALLVHLPYRVLLAVSLSAVALHNLADGFAAERLGPLAWLWQVLHQQALLIEKPPVVVAYPLVPWIFVMALGFCFGRVYRLPAERRGTLLLRLGAALTLAFVLVRASNQYGDPRPWGVQERGPVFTMLSFLNTTKYPPSLSFLLMTLGPVIAFLGWAERLRLHGDHPLVVLGRVPLFYFVLHIPLIHLVAVALTCSRYGAASFLLTPPPTLGTPRQVFPADYGWELWLVYVVAAGVVLALYPACLWFARFKLRRRDAWLSYV